MNFEISGFWASLLCLGIITYTISGTLFFLTAAWHMVEWSIEEAQEDRKDVEEALKRKAEHDG